MVLFERTYDTSAADLAADEALLDAVESGESAADGGVLRLYEPRIPAVVVGYGNRVTTEVDVDACLADGVPILRRSSGGGAVVLGPGCLAYAVVLPVDAVPELTTVTGTNRFVMERNRAAIQERVEGVVTIEGHTDLALDGRKFSGNAQRRRRRAVLFHGTILVGMGSAPIQRWLRMPSREPGYRGGRSHVDFVRDLPVRSEAVREALCEVWNAREPWAGGIDDAVETLVSEKFGREEWNLRM